MKTTIEYEVNHGGTMNNPTDIRRYKLRLEESDIQGVNGHNTTLILYRESYDHDGRAYWKSIGCISEDREKGYALHQLWCKAMTFM